MKESFTQLLVHLDATGHTARRIAAARALAQPHGAAITALYAVAPALLETPFAAEAGAAAVTLMREVDDDRRARTRAAFERAAALDGPHVAWAQMPGYPIVPAFARQALYADLLVLGQHDASDPSFAGVPDDFVEAVLAASGKPALVLPYQDSRAPIGETVVIAWKPTREAARAVGAAVPLLQRARRVHVLAWGEDAEREDGPLGLDGYLKLRGIEPRWHRETGKEPDFMGELLLSRAFDLEADLLVMGCYGHGRAREWILGGASRAVLASMTLPVLMAH